MNRNERWNVVETLPGNKVKVACDCGRTKELTTSSWEARKYLDHNCPYEHDLIGATFGRLTVVEPVRERVRNNIAFLCRCECGGEKVAIGSDLKRGNVRSCGCLQREVAAERGRQGFPKHEGYISYGYAHNLVRQARGSAKDFKCACGNQAREWAYMGGDPNELVGQETFVGMTYSRDVSLYEPRCAKCHRISDVAQKRTSTTTLGE